MAKVIVTKTKEYDYRAAKHFNRGDICMGSKGAVYIVVAIGGTNLRYASLASGGITHAGGKARKLQPEEVITLQNGV